MRPLQILARIQAELLALGWKYSETAPKTLRPDTAYLVEYRADVVPHNVLGDERQIFRGHYALRSRNTISSDRYLINIFENNLRIETVSYEADYDDAWYELDFIVEAMSVVEHN